MITGLPIVKAPQEQGAKCLECPLLDQTAVYSEPPSMLSPYWPKLGRIFVVGESPGGVEERKLRPLVGESGILFNHAIEKMGLERPWLHITNSILCRPLKHMSTAQWSAASAACLPRLLNELEGVAPRDLILALGARAIKALTGKNSVKAWRGYPLPCILPGFENALVFPTFHPAFVLRSPAYLPVWLIDLYRAIEFYDGTLKPWVWPDLYIHEGAELYAALERIRKADWVGVDVETAGNDPYNAPLLCIGLGTDEQDAEETEAVSLIWPAMDDDSRKLMLEILATKRIRKIYQNGNYDQISLDTWRIQHSGNDFDTLIAHRIIAPQIAHDLGFIASIEFPAERWKSIFRVSDDRKGSEVFAKAREDVGKFEALRLYNAKDALMTALLRRPLIKRMEEGGRK